MQYTGKYASPLGEILLACNDKGLTGLWFDQEKYYALSLDPENEEKETHVLQETRKWLDIYFTGKEPDFMPPICMIGTSFQLSVWNILRSIPYGETTTYGEIATQLAKENGLPRMSAQAVGGAVGHNEISIIIPCHRVVGKNGSLTGYAGGIDKKMALLKLEGAFQEKFFVPKHSTAP